jgi:hypothetical protein
MAAGAIAGSTLGGGSDNHWQHHSIFHRPLTSSIEPLNFLPKFVPQLSILALRGEIGQQLDDEFGAGKLDGVNLQSVPADEAQDVGYRSWRVDAARWI